MPANSEVDSVDLSDCSDTAKHHLLALQAHARRLRRLPNRPALRTNAARQGRLFAGIRDALSAIVPPAAFIKAALCQPAPWYRSYSACRFLGVMLAQFKAEGVGHAHNGAEVGLVWPGERAVEVFARQAGCLGHLGPAVGAGKKRRWDLEVECKFRIDLVVRPEGSAGLALE